MSGPVSFVFDDAPAPGEARSVADGVHWVRLPLPFKLDHVNVWLLDDGDGWTLVDTGIDLPEARSALEGVFQGRPLKRIIATHFHPDHIGLAGWLRDTTAAMLWMTAGEWATGRMLALDRHGEGMGDFRTFYRAAGFDAAQMALMERRGNPYPERITPIPGAYRRLLDGETVAIGDREWRVIVGMGHSPEHAALYCQALGVLISGDQVLPRISPNVSVWPQQPEANPLRLFLDSLGAFAPLPPETLVLPSHDGPFTGLHERLEALGHHHDERLEATIEACARPVTAVQVLETLFRRNLDDHQLFFAIGESLAHLHFLEGEGKVVCTRSEEGVDTWAAA